MKINISKEITKFEIKNQEIMKKTRFQEINKN